jgi:hypothetical protein
VPVEVLAGAVVAHGGPGVGVTGGDLHVAEADAGVEHRRHERVPQHVGMRPRHPDPRDLGEVLESAGGGMPVHPPTMAVAQNRPTGAFIDGPVDGSGDRGWQRNEDDLATFAAHTQDPVSVFLTQVGDVRPAGFEDPQPEQTQERDQGESFTLEDVRAVVIRASNCRCPSPRVGDSAGTVGRRT